MYIYTVIYVYMDIVISQVHHRCMFISQFHPYLLGPAGVPSIPWSGDGLTAELTKEGTIPDEVFATLEAETEWWQVNPFRSCVLCWCCSCIIFVHILRINDYMGIVIVFDIPLGQHLQEEQCGPQLKNAMPNGPKKHVTFSIQTYPMNPMQGSHKLSQSRVECRAVWRFFLPLIIPGPICPLTWWASWLLVISEYPHDVRNWCDFLFFWEGNCFVHVYTSPHLYNAMWWNVMTI